MKSVRTRVYPIICLAAFLSGSSGPALAWWVDGHAAQSRAAVLSLPDGVPGFFVDGRGTIAYFAADPDLAKNPNLSLLRDAERPEHYLDLELLDGRQLPNTRAGLIELCAELNVEPSQVGSVVYAIAEWTERLTLAFAEHRKWPDVEPLRLKCLLYAGLLAHYAPGFVPAPCTQPFTLMDGPVKADRLTAVSTKTSIPLSAGSNFSPERWCRPRLSSRSCP